MTRTQYPRAGGAAARVASALGSVEMYHTARVGCDGLARLANGRVVGRVLRGRDGVLTFVAQRDEARHLLRHPRGWALDADLLEVLAAAGVQQVEIHTPRATYRCLLRDYFSTSVVQFDRGHGRQRAVRIEQFRVQPRGARQLNLFETASAR